ncbi:hypothetical protein HU715_008600 [Pseudomonas sp. SWRI12]|uniref:Lipoprotein n=1 Tax=Pseudomonas zanjanensis TaxID=2745496 RepID=A0A923JJ47_9PSED|nr:hypothetical protein [Pseudomonas zanjanensis]MBV4495417.1 hypothetical protein [Pseudomonas zanjanensis]
MPKSNLLPMFSLAVLLSGCGNWDAIYHTHDFNEDSSALLDIKARAIISAPKDIVETNGARTTTRRIAICAEPSPDAMTAYAAQLATKADIPSQAALELTGAYQGAASYVGLRSQSIQLLRDQLYRLCEAHMNGAITTTQYEVLLTRNQRYTVGLMTIESLTQAMQVPVVSLTSSSTAQLYDDLKTVQAKLEEANEEKLAIEKIKESERSPVQIQRLKNLLATIEALNQRVKNGNLAIATGQTTAHASTNIGLSPGATQSAEAAERIAMALINTPDDGYRCFNYMQELAEKNAAVPTDGPNAQLYEFCSKVLADPQGRILMNQSKLTPGFLRQYLQALEKLNKKMENQ